jgi:hypothetical protein
MDWNETLTIVGLVILAGIAQFTGGSDLALAIGGGLVGYLTKGAQS